MSLDALVLGTPRPRRQFTGPQPAAVVRVTDGALYVELDALPDVEVGPCAWSRPLPPHRHADPDGLTGETVSADPPAGTRCLVALVGDGLGGPWLLAWDGWPA